MDGRDSASSPKATHAHAQHASSAEIFSSEPVKRKRGRPRKDVTIQSSQAPVSGKNAQLDAEKQNKGDEEAEAKGKEQRDVEENCKLDEDKFEVLQVATAIGFDHHASSAERSSSEPVKRGRGRPRKYTKDVKEASVSIQPSPLPDLYLSMHRPVSGKKAQLEGGKQNKGEEEEEAKMKEQRDVEELDEDKCEVLQAAPAIGFDHVIQLFGIIDESGSAWRERRLECTMYTDSMIGNMEYVGSTSGSDGSSHASLCDWAMRCKDTLFGKHVYKIGRVLATDDSYSGTGWIHGGQFVITCAHVVHHIQHNKQGILFQLPSKNVFIDLEVIYVCSPDSLTRSYLRDIAVLKMVRVQSPPTTSFTSLSIGSLDAGVLKRKPCFTETEKMINTGRIESMSKILVTTSAVANFGFFGGPVLDTQQKIIGMVQGARGGDIKTVAIIPIEKISEIIDIVIAMSPTCGLPPLPVPMQGASPTIPF